jgi:hypothetical protein
VETLVGVVESDALRYPARHTDVLVIAARVTGHDATDAIRTARDRRRSRRSADGQLGLQQDRPGTLRAYKDLVRRAAST